MSEIDLTDVDLSDTLFSDSEDVEIIDSNGTKYLAGYDDHGWFSIMHVQFFETEDGDFVPEGIGEYPIQSFTPEGAENLAELI